MDPVKHHQQDQIMYSQKPFLFEKVNILASKKINRELVQGIKIDTLYSGNLQLHGNSPNKMGTDYLLNSKKELHTQTQTFFTKNTEKNKEIYLKFGGNHQDNEQKLDCKLGSKKVKQEKKCVTRPNTAYCGYKKFTIKNL